MSYDFDRFLRFDELTAWLQNLAAQHPNLVEIESYGKSHQGRDLWLATITDRSTGPAADKPAHWVDANIHSVEVTAGVAACYLMQHLVDGYVNKDSIVSHALQTRTFYVVPRVNPDGVEASLADTPVFQRSSVRPWPWGDYKCPGIHESDVDGNGEILMMRVRDDTGGAWVEHPEDARVMIPVDHEDSPVQKGDYTTPRYRILKEGTIDNYDGWTIPQPANYTGLDLNRNFPAGWSKDIKGSGDHALSEVEINSLVRAIAARPNVCGYNAYHTNGGILLRPSSVRPDSAMSAVDVWTFKEIGKKYTELTGNSVYSCYEDFTFDKTSDCMSGAADDFMYEHYGVFSWTTEFWDVVHAATGHHADTKLWYLGNTVEESLAIARWASTNAPELFQGWTPFEHPQLGPVEIGGPNEFKLFTNPPPSFIKNEVAPHAQFAVHQALLSPKLEILHHSVEKLDMSSAWRIKIGVSNTGFLPTNVTEMATKIKAVLPVTVEIKAISSPDGDALVSDVNMLDGHSPDRALVGQLTGRQSMRVNWSGSDGTTDRALCVWTIVAAEGSFVRVTAFHQRAGRSSLIVQLK